MVINISIPSESSRVEISSMNLAEAYSLFMHGLNPQLCHLVGTLVSSGDLEEVIEVVKKATVYGEDKSNGGSQSKMKTNKNHSREVEKVAREVKGHGDPVGVDLR